MTQTAQQRACGEVQPTPSFFFSTSKENVSAMATCSPYAQTNDLLEQHGLFTSPLEGQKATSAKSTVSSGEDDDVPLAAFLFDSDSQNISTPTHDVCTCDSTNKNTGSDSSIRASISEKTSCEARDSKSQAPESAGYTSRTATTGTANICALASFHLSPSHASPTAQPPLAAPHRTSAKNFFLPVTPARQPQQCQPPRRTLTQTTLDLGQCGSDALGRQCPLCGMLFNTHAEDVTLHKRFCRAQQRRRGQQRAATTGRIHLEDASHRDYALVKNAVKLESNCTTSATALRASQSVSMKGEVEVQRGSTAVQLLEVLLESSFGAAVNSIASSQHHAVGTRSAKRADASVSRKRSRGTKHTQPGSLSSSAPASSEAKRTELFTCARVPLPESGKAMNPATRRTTPHSLEAIVITTSGGSNVLDQMITSNSNRDRTLMQLLDLIDFTHHLFSDDTCDTLQPDRGCFHSNACSSNKNNSIKEQSSGAATEEEGTTFVFVVDAVLRQLLCAVVGRKRCREQDPELCVRTTTDGSTRCGTRRVFTDGDVVDVWQLPSAALACVRKRWEDLAAAPYVSSQSTLQRFFNLPSTKIAPEAEEDTAVCKGLVGSVDGASGTEEKAKEKAAEERDECEYGLGVALRTLARHLTYGHVLCPCTQLSYARSVLARLAVTEGDAERNPSSANFLSGGEALLLNSLHVSASLYAESSRTTNSFPRSGTSFSVCDTGAKDADTLTTLFVHDDEVDVSDDESRLGDISGVNNNSSISRRKASMLNLDGVRDDGDAERGNAETDREGRKRRRLNSSSCSNCAQEGETMSINDKDGERGRSLSIVSYSSC